MIDPLLYLFHNYSDYDLVQTFRCVCTRFVTDNDFWLNFFNRTSLVTIFEEDIVECTHLIKELDCRLMCTLRQPPFNRSDNRVRRRKGLDEIPINKNPIIGCAGMLKLEIPPADIYMKMIMEASTSKYSSLIRTIRKAKCKRIITKIILERVVSIELVRFIFDEGAEADICSYLNNIDK